MIRRSVQRAIRKIRNKETRGIKGYQFGSSKGGNPRIAIVGGGPVGLTLSHLLHKSKIEFDLYEKNEPIVQEDGSMLSTKFRPLAAHYINTRSMEIISSVPNLRDELDEVLEELEDFRYYRYCRRIGDFQFWADSQYDRHVKSGLGFYSTQFPVHLSQNKFSYVLEKSIRGKLEADDSNNSTLAFNSKVLGFSQDSDMVRIEVQNPEQGGAVFEKEYDLLVAADGFHSGIRSQTQIGMTGEANMQSFLNVCFSSQKLVRALKRNKLQAMLHFVYNSDVIGCLVNHSYKDGIFVLQLPITPEIEDMDSLLSLSNRDMVLDLLSSKIRTSVEDDIKILNKGVWTMSSQVANRYHENRLVLAGDSAHSIPPAGGLGMNTGLQDAHNLACKLSQFYQQEESGAENMQDLLRKYSQERKSAALVNKKTSDELYSNSLRVAENMLLSTKTLGFLKTAIDLIPTSKNSKSTIFDSIKKNGTSFLESDSVFKKLTKNIREDKKLVSRESWGGRWIPMILLEEECKIKYNGTEVEGIFEEGETRIPLAGDKYAERIDKYCGLLAKISFVELKKWDSEELTHVCFRTIFDEYLTGEDTQRDVVITNLDYSTLADIFSIGFLDKNLKIGLEKKPTMGEGELEEGTLQVEGEVKEKDFDFLVKNYDDVYSEYSELSEVDETPFCMVLRNDGHIRDFLMVKSEE